MSVPIASAQCGIYVVLLKVKYNLWDEKMEHFHLVCVELIEIVDVEEFYK